MIIFIAIYLPTTIAAIWFGIFYGGKYDKKYKPKRTSKDDIILLIIISLLLPPFSLFMSLWDFYDKKLWK